MPVRINKRAVLSMHFEAADSADSNEEVESSIRVPFPINNLFKVCSPGQINLSDGPLDFVKVFVGHHHRVHLPSGICSIL